jgi:hypothetical protein
MGPEWLLSNRLTNFLNIQAYKTVSSHMGNVSDFELGITLN